MAEVKTLRFEFLADTKKFLGKVGAVGKKFDALGKDMNRVGGQINKVFAGLGVAAGAGAAKAIGEFRAFEDGMLEVFTLMPGISKEAMDIMERDVLATSKAIGVLPEDVIPSLYNSLSAGVPPDNVFEFIQTANKLAVGGATDLGVAVDGLTSVVNAFGPEAVSFEKASDLIFTAVKGGKTTVDELSRSLFQVAPVAAGLGVEFGDVTAALATLTAAGTPTSVAATQLRAVFAELSKPTTVISKKFQELAGKDFATFIAEGGNVADALNLISDDAKASGVSLSAYFGSVEAAGAAQVLTGKGAEKFAAEIKAAGDAVGATDQAFQTGASGIGLVLDKIRAGISVFTIEIGQKLAPVLLDFIDNARATFERLQPKIQAFSDGIREFIGSDQFRSIINSINVAFSELEARLSPVFERIREFFKENPKVAFTGLAVVIGGILLASVVSLATAFAALFSPFVLILGAVAALAAGFRFAYDNVEEFRNFVDNSVSFLRDLFSRFIAFFKGDGFQNGIKTALDFVTLQFDNIKKFITGIVEFIKALFSGDVERAVAGFKLAFSGILDFFKNNFNLFKVLKDIFVGALSKLIDFLKPKLKEFGSNFLETLSTVFKTSAGVLLEGVKFVFNKVIDKINEFINKVNDGLGFSFFGIDIDPPDIPNLPRLAKGGIVTQPTRALIGERGPEAIIPLSRAGDNLGQTNINLTVNAGMGTDGASVGRQIVEELRKFQRSNGPLPLRLSGFDLA
jgi:TP901 family phage tail tape measure protein|tara:strand:+ start:2785 stop:5004 length:2220 start_codon:yes stop_codon:yes gene_type:complete